MTEAARRERHARAAELRQTPSSTQAGACPMPVRGLPGTLAEAPFEGEWLCDWLSNSGRIVKITDSRMFVAGCPNAVEIKITSFTTCEVDLQGTLCKGLLSEDLTKIKWFPDQVEWSRKQADAAGATGPASRATPTLVEHRSRSRSPLQRREMLPRRSRPASRQQYQPRSPPQPWSDSRSRNRPSGRDQAATCTTATTTCQQSIPRPSSTRHGCVAIEIRDVSHGSVILHRQDRAARSRSPAGVATPQRRPRPTRRAHFSSPAPGSVRVSRPQSPAVPQDGNCEVAIQTEAGDAQEQQRFAITMVEKSESRAPSMPVLQLQCTVVTREIVEVRYQGTQLPVEVGTVGKVVQHEPGLQKVVVQWKIARIGVIKTRVRSAVLEPRQSADDVNRALFPVNTCAQLEYPPRMPSDEYPISADPGPCRSIFARWVRLLEKVANYEIAKLSRWSPSADLEPDMQDLQKQDFHHLILAAKSAKLRTMQVMKQAMRHPDAALLEELEKRQSMAGIEEHVAKLAKSLGMD